jgi:hypothetical protein
MRVDRSQLTLDRWQLRGKCILLKEVAEWQPLLLCMFVIAHMDLRPIIRKRLRRKKGWGAVLRRQTGVA